LTDKNKTFAEYWKAYFSCKDWKGKPPHKTKNY